MRIYNWLVYGVCVCVCRLTGSDYNPSKLSGRFFVMSMLLMSLLVFNFYTSMLVSTLIQETSKNKIKSLDDLADSDFRVGFDDDDLSIKSFLNVSQFASKHLPNYTQPKLIAFLDYGSFCNMCARGISQQKRQIICT